MKTDFLLGSKTSKELYDYVKDLPVIDYHNHLSLDDINSNKRYTDVYELWIKPDPYKHRAMRMCGVNEEYITGKASNKEKFVKWCETVPMLLGNPLYHWAVTKLEAVFGISEAPNEENAEKIYDSCNRFLEENIVTANSILEKFNVEAACPCAYLIDDISMFENSKSLSPSLRGDDIVSLCPEFVKKLESITKSEISDLNSLKNAIRKRLDLFYDYGCRFSDHTLDNGFVFYKDDGENEKRFKLILSDELTDGEKAKFSSYMLIFLGEEYAKRKFTMQFHIC